MLHFYYYYIAGFWSITGRKLMNSALMTVLLASYGVANSLRGGGGVV